MQLRRTFMVIDKHLRQTKQKQHFNVKVTTLAKNRLLLENLPYFRLKSTRKNKGKQFDVKASSVLDV